MIVRMKNTAHREVPITVRIDDYFGDHIYPGLVMHAGATIDFAKWGIGDDLWDVINHLSTSDDWLRDFLSGAITIVQLVA